MYSIKTDLGVSGNGTINKDLLVKGNAVINGNLKVDGTVDFANATFTEITVTGTANLTDINSTGTASLENVAVSGDTVLGDASTDTVTVNGTSTFAAPATFNGNVSQTAGTASFKETSVDSLTVAGVSNLNGNLNMGADTKATMKDLETDTLQVNGASVLDGTLNVTGKTTLGDVEINGTLSGTYTINTGNFNNIVVSQLSDLNNVSIKGATTLNGNVSGANSTVSVKRLNMQGSDAIVEFAYNDPSRPNDTKSSIEPYQVSSQTVVAKNVTTNAADIGVVGGTEGLHALGKATIDYLNITGNSTIGDQNQLQVAGKSVFTGKTTVGDLEITGSVTGLTFSDLNVDALTVTGQSTLQGGVSIGGNITGSNSTIAKFSTLTMADGTGGNHGIIQFEYADAGRPTDIKSSIEPYQVSTNDLTSRNFTTEGANIGVVGGTSGLHALGKATIDYLNITGNSTIGTTSPQLKVDGDSELQDTTVRDLNITGTVTGLAFDALNVTTLTVSGNSTLQGGVSVGGNLTGGNTSIAKFSTFTVADGTDGNHGIIQFDYADSGRPSDIKSSIEPYKVSSQDIVSGNVETQNATVGNVDGTAGLTALGKSTMDYVHIQGNSTIGTAQPQLQVDGKSVLADVEFTGVVTGLTVDVSGQDLTPNSVVAAAALKGDTLESVTNLTVGGTAGITGNTTIGGTLGVTGEITATAGATIGGDVTVNGQTVTVKDLVVTGTTTGVTAEANVDGLDIKPNSVVSTTSVTAATASVTGALDAGSVSTTGNATVGGTLNVTGQTVLADVEAENIVVSSITNTGASDLKAVTATTLTVPTVNGDTTFANDVTITGVLTPASIDLSTTAVDAASVTTTGDVNVGGNLVVSGTFDLSAADVSVKSITATAAQSTIPTLASSNATITTLNAGDIDATGDVSAASVAATGDVSAATATVPTIQAQAAGAGTVTIASNAVAAKDLTVTGVLSPNGGIVTTGDISAANITATAVLKGASVESETIQAAPLGAGVVNIASDVVAAKDLTVTGTFKPEGGLDLSAVDITSKSLTTTEGATIGGNLSVAGTVDLSGADVTALSFVSSDELKTNTFPKLASAEANIGALTVTGTTTLADTNTGTLDVTGASTLAAVTATAIDATSLTATAAVSAASFTTADTTVQIAKSTNVDGDLHATGTITAGAIDLSTTDVIVKSLDSLGNAHVAGDLTVDGQFDLSATNLQAASLTSTGLTKVGTTLEVVGASTLSTLGTSGLATLNSAEVTTTLAVTGASTLAGVSATNITASGTLGVTGNTTLTTLTTSGLATLNSASVSGTLDVTGDTTLAGLTAGATSVSTLASSDKATLASLEITGATVAKGNLTVEGTLLPQGGLDLTGADIEANSLDLAAGATIGTTLGVTGNTTVGGTLTSTGAGKFGSVTSDNGLTVTAGATTLGGAITASGAGKFDSVTADNGLTVTTGGVTIAAGNIVQSGVALDTSASFKKTSVTNLHVGSLVWDEEEYIAEIGGNTHISGDLDVDGTINAQINLTGRDIAPRAVNASTSITVGTTLTVSGQSTMASAIIGAPDSVNNNLQINGNTVCTGDFTVGGSIIGTLDQSTSDVVAKSVTASTFIKGATLESTAGTTVGTTLSVGTTATIGGKLTVSAGGADVTGGLAVDTITTTGVVGVGGKLTVSAGGLAVTGGTATDTLTVTGTTNLAAVTAGAVTAASLTVSGTSNFTGKVTAVDLESTGTITANNLTVTGTLDANIADLATDSITTQKYEVIPATSATVASGTTWTSDGSSNVYNLTLTGAAGAVNIAPLPIVAGKAASWFIYITQDSIGGKTVNWDTSMSQIGDSIVNTAANSVSICQVVYCGVGSIVDVFIAQRNL